MTTRHIARRLVVCVIAAVLAWPRAARADDAAELEYARTRLDGGLYEEAMKRLNTILDPSLPPCDKGPSGACRLTDPDLIERARSLAAIALVALGRTGEADAQIEKILRNNPSFVAGPPLFPIAVSDRFTAMRNKLKPELDKLLTTKAANEHAQLVYEEQRKKWLEDVQRLASQETIVTPNSRWVALLPFGVGHFQNGNKTFGIFFAGLEAVTISGQLVTAAIVSKLESVDVTKPVDPDAPNPVLPNVPQLNSEIQAASTVNRVFFATWATAVVIDVVTAQATFVPETTTVRTRPIPAPPKPPPPVASVSIAPTRGGAMIGVTGQF